MNFPSAFYFSRIPSQLVVIALIVLSSCGGNDDPKPPALPQVSAIAPTSGLVNTAVVITGTNFSTVLGENKVTFNGKEAVITAATVTQLTVTVPMDAETGAVAVTVNGQGAANKPVFTVESSTPEVTGLTPTSGLTNTPVVISGTNFSKVLGENKVTFNGKDAVITAASVTQLTVTVPMDAATGPVSVTVNGHAASNKPVFTVESPAPEVTELAPTFGLTNTPVVIKGANFSTILSENKVSFNGKDAVITAATPTQLTVTVPLLSETGPVVVSVKGKTAVNQPVFRVLVIPVLTTSPVSTDVTLTNAIGGGNITSEGGSAVTARGICWSTSPSPTILNSKTTNGSGLGVFSSSITGLTAGITYYVRAYATNSFGTAYGNEVTFKSLPIAGAKYQGGIIAYVFQPNDPGYDAEQSHGLIAATEDQATDHSWWAPHNEVTGATGTALGTGMANTIAIVGKSKYCAAHICFDYKVGIYEDWFLPSKDELDKLFIAKDIVGGFYGTFYWTSTEVSLDGAWIQDFFTRVQSTYDKKGEFRVRAVRYF